MAKFVFELLDGYAETSLFIPTASELVMLFSPKLQGYVTVGDSAYEIEDGRVSIPTSALPKGEFLPELVAKVGRWALPRLVYDGEAVYPKPYDDEYIRELTRRIEEITKVLHKINEDAKKIKDTVYGKLLF